MKHNTNSKTTTRNTSKPGEANLKNDQKAKSKTSKQKGTNLKDKNGKQGRTILTSTQNNCARKELKEVPEEKMVPLTGEPNGTYMITDLLTSVNSNRGIGNKYDKDGNQIPLLSAKQKYINNDTGATIWKFPEFKQHTHEMSQKFRQDARSWKAPVPADKYQPSEEVIEKGDQYIFDRKLTQLSDATVAEHKKAERRNKKFHKKNQKAVKKWNKKMRESGFCNKQIQDRETFNQPRQQMTSARFNFTEEEQHRIYRSWLHRGNFHPGKKKKCLKSCGRCNHSRRAFEMALDGYGHQEIARALDAGRSTITEDLQKWKADAEEAYWASLNKRSKARAKLEAQGKDPDQAKQCPIFGTFDDTAKEKAAYEAKREQLKEELGQIAKYGIKDKQAAISAIRPLVFPRRSDCQIWETLKLIAIKSET